MSEDNRPTQTEMLIRLDERTKSMKDELQKLNEEISALKRQIKEDRNEDKESLDKYVTKEEFAPIQRVLYAIASLIIMTVVGTLINIVIQKGT